MLKFQNNLHILSMSGACLIFTIEISGIAVFALFDISNRLLLFLSSKPFIESAWSTWCIVNAISPSVKGVTAFDRSVLNAFWNARVIITDYMKDFTVLAITPTY